MLVGLSSAEWSLLLTAVVPAVLAVIVVYGFWRWAKRGPVDSERAAVEAELLRTHPPSDDRGA